MTRITVQIDGMRCGMCESHINDAIRRNFRVKKVASSHAKGICVLFAEEDIPDDALRAAIESTGYRVLAVRREDAGGKPAEKKGLFAFLRRS